MNASSEFPKPWGWGLSSLQGRISEIPGFPELISDWPYGSNREQSLAGSKYRIPEILFLFYFLTVPHLRVKEGNPHNSCCYLHGPATVSFQELVCRGMLVSLTYLFLFHCMTFC